MITSRPLGMPQVGVPLGSPLFSSQPSPAAPTPLPAQPPEASLERALNYYADYSGCGLWRMIWPEHILNMTQKSIVHGTTMMILDERYYQDVKSVRLQRQATDTQLRFVRLLKDYQKRSNFKIIYDIDDVIFHEDIPEYNKFKPAFVDPQIRESACAIMRESDEISVNSKFMKDYYASKTGHKNVTVIPLYPPRFWIGEFYDPAKISNNYDKHRKKPRVLYPASGAHFDVDNRVGQKDDFFHVNQAIIKTVNEFQWVFIGAFPLTLLPYVQSGKIEFHPWQRIYDYPRLINKLNVNAFIAPLQNNNFNKGKSDLKHLEACCFGLPSVCQDMCTFADAEFKFNTGDDMIDQLRLIFRHEGKYMKLSRRARDVAETRWLELDENISKYHELYTMPYGSPERKYINSLADNR